MSRGGRGRARFTRALMQHRAAAVAAGYPLMLYSYSSRAVTDLPSFYAATKAGNPRPLLSLYDIYHHLGCEAIQNDSTTAGRVFDSGNYEVAATGDPWVLAGPPGDRPWTMALYAETARRVVQPGDTLVSFDAFDCQLEEQVERAFAGFETVGVSGVRRDLLLHPNGMAPRDVAAIVARDAPEIDLLGLTEKDLGLPWYVGASYLRELRAVLTATLDRYLPIHVFGCLDPRNVPLLFFAGADVFDGLAWARYYFRDRHAYYVREFEHDASIEALRDWTMTLQALSSHNIEVMESLRAGLQYAVLSSDGTEFASSLELLAAIWEESQNGR